MVGVQLGLGREPKGLFLYSTSLKLIPEFGQEGPTPPPLTPTPSLALPSLQKPQYT